MLIISSVHRITSLVSASTAPGAESGTLGCLVHHRSLRLCMQRSLKIFGMQDMALHICDAAGSYVHQMDDVTAQCRTATSWASVYNGPICRSRHTLLFGPPLEPETVEAANPQDLWHARHGLLMISVCNTGVQHVQAGVLCVRPQVQVQAHPATWAPTTSRDI